MCAVAYVVANTYIPLPQSAMPPLYSQELTNTYFFQNLQIMFFTNHCFHVAHRSQPPLERILDQLLLSPTYFLTYYKGDRSRSNWSNSNNCGRNRGSHDWSNCSQTPEVAARAAVTGAAAPKQPRPLPKQLQPELL